MTSCFIKSWICFSGSALVNDIAASSTEGAVLTSKVNRFGKWSTASENSKPIAGTNAKKRSTKIRKSQAETSWRVWRQNPSATFTLRTNDNERAAEGLNDFYSIKNTYKQEFKFDCLTKSATWVYSDEVVKLSTVTLAELSRINSFFIDHPYRTSLKCQPGKFQPNPPAFSF